jgi:hypothetical protein
MKEAEEAARNMAYPSIFFIDITVYERDEGHDSEAPRFYSLRVIL